jgi:hypothetical protein
MPRLFFTCLTIAALLCINAAQSVADVFELRTYTTNEDKLDALHSRFRDHTIELFNKHGMTSVGYWVPTDGPASKNTLIYVLQHQSRDAATASWKAFIADPVWQAAFKASRIDGPLLSKAPESVFMDAADYSPAFKSGKADSDAVFELRTYRCNKGKLSGLDSRFRDHTIQLFQKHGIASVAYWHPADEPASKDTLIYIIRHDSRDAAAASWKAFGSDEEWKKVASESQRDGKFLREKPESIYMIATDYSAIQ